MLPFLSSWNKGCLSGIFLFIATGFLLGQQSIDQVKLLPLGSVVTTTGTINSGQEFGQIRYMQNAIAGIALYSTSLASTKAGDSIIVTGVLSRYRGELQLSPVMSYQLIATGKKIKPTLTSGFKDLNSPLFESLQITLSCAGISSCEPDLQSGWYNLYDDQGQINRMVITDGQSLVGKPIPNKPITITGIWTILDDQYQLLAQTITDASEGNCHILPPGQISFTSDAVMLSWDNVPNAETWFEYGDSTLSNFINLGTVQGAIDFALSTLSPGVLYRGRLGQVNELQDTFYSPSIWFTSVVEHDLPIEILFDRNVNTTFSDGSHPLATGSSAIESDIIQRIDQVSSTLDIAMYNTTRTSIVQAITRAAQRGVVVRYIADDETSNTALNGVQAFPILFRSGDGIMHNKFVIADVDDPQKAWLWAGSTNFTTNQLSSDPNHAYIIHDQALARNYTSEFEEMWGQSANHNDSRTGGMKTDNTVHLFQIGGVRIESYFSPSDETSCHILEAIQSTNHHIEIGLLLLTKDDLIDEIILLHQQGVEVRVILEDEASSSTAYARLIAAGIPVVTHDFSPIFHHKYAIIDEGFPNSDPQVVTGSHNWTWSADNINDENTLIIHDQSITNIFRQEFEARWSELNTTSSQEFLEQRIEVYPNPATTSISVSNPLDIPCSIQLIDLSGRVLFSTNLAKEAKAKIHLEPICAAGIYILQFNWAGHQNISRILVVTNDDK